MTIIASGLGPKAQLGPGTVDAARARSRLYIFNCCIYSYISVYGYIYSIVTRNIQLYNIVELDKLSPT